MKAAPTLAVLITIASLSACANAPGPVSAADPARAATSPPDTPSARDAQQADGSRLARDVTVRIRNVPCGGGVGVGTGFLLDDHTLVTNRHVVEDAWRLDLETWDGQHLSTEVVSIGTTADLAVVRVSHGVGESIAMAHEDPDEATEVRAVGYAEGGPQRTTEGTIVNYVTDPRLGNIGPVMRLTNDVLPGNSGGPLIDNSGAVVGVVYAIEIATNYGLALPVSTLRDALDAGAGMHTMESC